MTAVLQGLRRIADLARVTIFGALIGTVLGLAAILWLGQSGLPVLLAALSFGQLLIAAWFTLKLPSSVGSVPVSDPPQGGLATWFDMARLGTAFMLGGLVTTATLLGVRSLIQHRLGLEAIGQFEASWAMAITYLGFVLNAMSADYYPRLSGAIHDPERVNLLVNEQIQLGLLLAGPMLLLLIGLAPVLVPLLYSAAFEDAIIVLQWQTVGNFFKLSSWAMGFVVLASGRGGLFLLLELAFSFFFATILWVQLDRFGVLAAGPAFALAYAIHFVTTLAAARHLCGLRWAPESRALQLIYIIAAVILLALARTSPLAGAAAAVVGAAIGAILGLRYLLSKTRTTHPLAARIERFFSGIGWHLSHDKDTLG